jgi:hypothetical protein
MIVWLRFEVLVVEAGTLEWALGRNVSTLSCPAPRYATSAPRPEVVHTG